MEPDAVRNTFHHWDSDRDCLSNTNYLGHTNYFVINAYLNALISFCLAL